MVFVLAMSGRLGSSHEDWFSFWDPRNIDKGRLSTVDSMCKLENTYLQDKIGQII